MLDPLHLLHEVVHVIGMGLMLYGVVHSWRAAPQSAAGILCAAWAWTGADWYRATSDRVVELAEGHSLDFEPIKMWVVAGFTAVTLVCFGLALFIVVRSRLRA